MIQPQQVPSSANPRLVRQEGVLVPQLVREQPGEITESIRARRAGFTPDWSGLATQDAGSALVRLFGEMAALVHHRVNQLPRKLAAELLQAADIRMRAIRPADVLLQFTASPNSTQSIVVPSGFAVAGRSALTSDGLIVFETSDNVYVTPAKLKSGRLLTGATSRSVTLPSVGTSSAEIALFEAQSQPGDAFYLGFESKGAVPSPELSLYLQIDNSSGQSPTYSMGGLEVDREGFGPVLRWEAVAGGGFNPVEVVSDETRNFQRSGVIVLRTPREWTVQDPFGTNESLYWLRLRLVLGKFAISPALSGIALNAVRARSVRSVRDEILEQIEGMDPPQMKLARPPVVPGSLILEVEELRNEAMGTPASRWREVVDLFAAGPEDRVFLLDAERGILTFGDGRHGTALPSGYRHVRAVRYESLNLGDVAVGSVTTILASLPNLSAVTNLLASSGGISSESDSEMIRVGPRLIRCGGRAVTTADYALLCLGAAGADIRRAYALSGTRPGSSANSTPGVVTVLVVPAPKGAGPPIPDEETLRAVAQHLVANGSPAGVEVVVGAPIYRSVQTQVGIEVVFGAKPSDVVGSVIDALDRYFHPLTGGDGEGWPFGGTLERMAIIRYLLGAVPGLSAISNLRILIDGVLQPADQNIRLGLSELLWPVGHEVVPEQGGPNT